MRRISFLLIAVVLTLGCGNRGKVEMSTQTFDKPTEPPKVMDAGGGLPKPPSSLPPQ